MNIAVAGADLGINEANPGSLDSKESDIEHQGGICWNDTHLVLTVGEFRWQDQPPFATLFHTHKPFVKTPYDLPGTEGKAQASRIPKLDTSAIRLACIV